jgi:hypothetical protein
LRVHHTGPAPRIRFARLMRDRISSYSTSFALMREKGTWMVIHPLAYDRHAWWVCSAGIL